MSDPPRDLYDDVPYAGGAIGRSHPRYLAGLARLCGLDPAPSGHARVAEIGCGDGINLLPMAAAAPQARFVGVDLSARAIERGQRLAAAAGLANVTLIAADLRAVPLERAGFDYVLAHGVYSWVPESVREGLMALVGNLLAPDGIGFVSHSALPGGWIAQSMRHVLLRLCGGTTPAAAIRAQALVQAMSADADPERPWGALVREEAQKLLTTPDGDAYLLHNHMAADRVPETGDAFGRRAARHGLRVAGDAHWSAQWLRALPAPARAWLDAAGADPVARGDRLDWLTWRGYRQHMLCRAERAPLSLPAAERIGDLIVSAPVEVPDGVDLARGVPVPFKFGDGSGVTIRDRLVKAALTALAHARPRGLAFPALLDAARALLLRAGERVAPDREADARALGPALMRLFDLPAVSLCDHQPALPAAPGERPCACPLARAMAAEGAVPISLTMHTEILLTDETARRVLAALDGTRDRASLARDFAVPPATLAGLIHSLFLHGLIVG